ncbi:GNAT family N-acetyltransferase [Neobacillus ginsengisoli]|uniref:GNAT family acetyltransferase n=1 Tax=Neobacillus ginsengisoli TaxID=904295 RepID=A0ABT9XQL0_9BACI|nr:GNAT family N-acetyltransferase [Neobacillus ginsengisoli]MDQ0197841.1 putative GNAT family acetyltransferase [Neobacillus ginsengisoli]
MIRKLTLKDHENVLSYLREEPSINLFIIGDLEAFGYDSDFQEVWAEFDESNEINAVLLRFYQSFIPYAKGEFDIGSFVSIMKEFKQPISTSGKTALIDKFEQFEELKLGKKQVTFFAECRTDEYLGTTDLEIKKAGFDEVDQIIRLRRTIEEFHVKDDAREILVKAMESNTARTYYTEENGISSCVSTAAENSQSVMIVGVCTRKENRRQGLATAIMQKLFKDVLDEGKTLCLFYDNPEAGRIYKRLGFKDIGMWTMYR